MNLGKSEQVHTFAVTLNNKFHSKLCILSGNVLNISQQVNSDNKFVMGFCSFENSLAVS